MNDNNSVNNNSPTSLKRPSPNRRFTPLPSPPKRSRTIRVTKFVFLSVDLLASQLCIHFTQQELFKTLSRVNKQFYQAVHCEHLWSNRTLTIKSQNARRMKEVSILDKCSFSHIVVLSGTQSLLNEDCLYFKRFSNLITLELHLINMLEIEWILHSFVHLKKLRLVDCDVISSEYIRTNTSLDHLSFERVRESFSTQPLNLVSIINATQSLKILDFNCVSNLNTLAMKEIFDKCKLLENLIIVSCDVLVDTDFAPMVKSEMSLKLLKLQKNYEISTNVYKYICLSKSSNSLTYLNTKIYHTNVNTEMIVDQLTALKVLKARASDHEYLVQNNLINSELEAIHFRETGEATFSLMLRDYFEENKFTFRLKYLKLEDNLITRALCRLTNAPCRNTLETLNLSGRIDIPEENDIEIQSALLESFPACKNITVTRLNTFKAESIEYFIHLFPNAEKFSFVECSFEEKNNDERAYHRETYTRSRPLHRTVHTISISDCMGFTDVILRVCLASCPNLKHIHLERLTQNRVFRAWNPSRYVQRPLVQSLHLEDIHIGLDDWLLLVVVLFPYIQLFRVSECSIVDIAGDKFSEFMNASLSRAGGRTEFASPDLQKQLLSIQKSIYESSVPFERMIVFSQTRPEAYHRNLFIIRTLKSTIMNNNRLSMYMSPIVNRTIPSLF
jgi:hypothetical protein